MKAGRNHGTRRGNSATLRFENLEPRQLLTTYVVDSLDDETNDDHLTSLREALEFSNAYPDHDTIQFADSLLNGTITLTNGELEIRHNVAIEGPGAEFLRIDANDPSPGWVNGDGSRVFNIQSSSNDVILRGLTLTGGDVSGSGGAILAHEGADNVLIDEVWISGNQAAHNGGGILSEAQKIEIRNSYITGNTAIRNGGGIQADYGLSITNSTISRNEAGVAGDRDGWGGGIYAGVDEFRTSIDNATISHNRATRGGGVFISHREPDGSAIVSNSTISNNSAEEGAGIAGDGFFTITTSLISENDALPQNGSYLGGLGGGLFIGDGRITVSNSTIASNRSLNNAGGVHVESGTLIIHSSTVSDNSADSIGGGIHLAPNATLDATAATIVNNRRGGITAGSLRDIRLNHSIVAKNSGIFGSMDFGLTGEFDGPVWAQFSFLGDGTSGIPTTFPGQVDDDGNISGSNDAPLAPGLGELADNGGATPTHLPNTDSPVIDAGLRGTDSLAFDQRGVPFHRKSGQAFDMGSIEAQLTPGDYDGDGTLGCEDLGLLADEFFAVHKTGSRFDLNLDGSVDVGDQTVWLEFAGEKNLPSRLPYLRGDANLDGRVDKVDLNIVARHWRQRAGSWCSGDFNASGTSDEADLNILALNWQKDVTGIVAEHAALVAIDSERAGPDGEMLAQNESVSQQLQGANQESTVGKKRVFRSTYQRRTPVVQETTTERLDDYVLIWSIEQLPHKLRTH